MQTKIGKKKVFLIRKVKDNASPYTYGIIDLNGEEIIGTFYEKKRNSKKKPNKKNCHIKINEYFLNHVVHQEI